MAETAERGCIYEFLEKDGSSKNMMLVIGNNRRQMETLVSVLMLNTTDKGNDAVGIWIEEEMYVVHCGLVTYCSRSRLGRKVTKISDARMELIDNGVKYQLGLTEEREDYKTLYENLLDKVVGK